MNWNSHKARTAQIFTVAVALMMAILPACGAAPAAFTASITSPDSTTPLTVSKAINITGKVSGGGLKAVDVYIDGVKYARVDTPVQNNEFAVDVPWTPDKAGAHVIQLKGLDDKGAVLVSSDVLFVTVIGAAAPTAAPATPTIAPTAAPAAATAPVTTTSQTTATINAPMVSVKEGDFVNVRSGPAIAYDKVGTLDRGQSVAIKGKNADGTWWQINFPTATGGVGWVFGTLVNTAGDTSKLTVASAPPLPTAEPTSVVVNTPVPPTAIPVPTSNLPPSALLPYSQNMRFSPRDNIGDVPLGYKDEGKTTSLLWEVNGATKLELEITSAAGSGIFANCPAGNLSSVTPNNATVSHVQLAVPSGSYQLTIPDKGYYLVKIYVVKTDGSTTFIPRNVIVDCYKTQ